MNQPCDLSIVIVSWNVWPLLADCLRSIEQASRPLPGAAQLRHFGPPDRPATLEVIVVDNASRDATTTEAPLAFPWVRLIRSDENLGFTRGNNVGYAASSGRFVYFLNPDTEQTGMQPNLAEQRPAQSTPADSLWLLYAALAGADDVAMVGPQLRYADGSWQSSRRRFPTPLTGCFESTWLGRAWPANPWARRLQMADWPATFRQDVDWLVGAAILCRRRALEETRTVAGPFDERFFMYSEELDLARRLRGAGWRVLYAPEAVVIHHEGKSSDQAAAARHVHFNTSKVRYAAKWFGPGWSELLRRYLLLEFRIQLVVEAVKWLLRSKPALRRERIAAYRQVLRSGLR
jgi:GT2 family glycosyltransferase